MRSRARSLWVVIGLTLILYLAACGRTENRTTGNVKIVGITQIASHPSLDSVRKGIISGLEAAGWRDGKNIRFIYRNANRDAGLALPIVQSFVAEGVDVIVPITTPSAVAASQATKTIPIVFGGVTDPLGIGLVRDLNRPGGNITGTSDRWPFAEQLSLFKRLMPAIRRLGMLYTPGDTVSAIAVKELRLLCPRYGVELVAIPISSVQDLYSAARQLFLRVDAVYTGLDTLVVENVESILKAGREARKPTFAGDEGTVRRGALATYGINMVDLGLETSKLVDRVLRGEHPGSIPVVVVKGGNPVLNRSALKEFNIDLPGEVSQTAVMVD